MLYFSICSAIVTQGGLSSDNYNFNLQAHLFVLA